MGNSESQYSIQGPKGTSFVFPGKQKPYSLKLRSAKDNALSPHSWWKSAPVGSGYKARCVGRGCLSPPKSRQPYSARHYDYVSKGVRGSPSEHRWHRSPGCGMRRRHMSDEYEENPYGSELNGNMLNGHSDEHEAVEEQSSPRVVIKKDGSLRVEFTNTSGNALLLDETSGPVQLLKFSPNLESASTPSLPGSGDDRPDGHRSGPPPASTSSTARTSKGSSLSSDGSWYDSPWGPSTELCDSDQPCSASRTLVPSPIHQLDSFIKQSPPVSITDLYRDPTMAATFPSARDLSSQLLEPPVGPRPHRASFASVLDVPLEEECPEARQYSSYTLPCRRPKAHTLSEDLDQYPDREQQQEQAEPDFSFYKKDSIKNRIRRFSDWTGSLSRKKRKSQDARYKDLTDAFDSGVDGLTADTSSPSQVSSLFWFPGASRAQSSGAIHQTTSDALRQNIYENFMRELETGTGQVAGERREPSTGTEEGESSSESVEGSLEELDLLFEKEQGVVRRAGWLSFKPLITLHKDRKLELVTRRKWKQYWVTLKGCTLLFYETYGKGSPEQDLSPRYALLAEDSIVQAVPEHPKKENVFCLSNSYGDVYLFQATNQTDLENWVTAVHSASASLLAKRQGKEDTVRLLRTQVRGLLQKIDMDGKMKKMAELQLTVVSDPKNRKAIENQIQQWEQNLERFNMDLFRMRCYLASLQGGELPNPKSLLAIASRPTKTTLGRLGIFSVSSFHALICSRDEATLRRRSLSLTYRQRKRGLFSSLKGLDNLTKRGRDKRPSASQIFESDAGGQTYALPPRSTERLDVLASIYSMSPPEGGVWDSINGATDVLTCVHMPDGLTVQIPVRRDQPATDLLSAACKVKQLDPGLHCLRLHRRGGQEVEVRYVTPVELVHDVVNDQLEVVPVNVFTLHMSKSSGAGDFGFAVTGHIDSQKNSRIFVSEVLPDGLAFNEGLRPGDEILVLNGRCVSGLDLTLIQTLFAEQNLHLSLRRDGASPVNVSSKHLAPPPKHNLEIRSKHHRAKSSSDVCTAADGGESLCVGLENGHSHCAHRPVQHSKSVDTVCTLYQSFHEGTSSGGLMDDTKVPPVRQGGEMASGPRGEATLLRPCPKHMSATERLRKVIQELVDTEKSYVKDLACLFEIYLKPLQNETFLTLDEMESLFGSLPEMLDFQRVFLQTLEERIASSPDFNTLETPSQFKKLLFSLGGSFLYYADHFKLYSGFCANHIKVQKVLERAKTDQAFKEFLDARNPTKQHSSTLESYLIKPVQRVLKYPLLLRELVSLTDADSEEHYHLSEALKAMEKVASHINEMQKIYEDYGSVFDQLVAEQTGHDKEVTEISMGEFLMHSSVFWLNPHPSLGRMRKDPEITVFVFKKAVILVYRDNNKLKKKMTNPRSALSHGDSDPVKFRWLIPLSALQVRLGNTAGTGTESSCIWELVHSRSEVEGRPETVFQLCSSVPESKVSIVKVIRSILREKNVRRNMRSEGTLERNCKERLAPLRSTLPSSAKLGSSRASWVCNKPLGDLSTQAGNPKPGPDSDEGSLSSGTYSLSGVHPLCTPSDTNNLPFQQNWSHTPGCNPQPPSTSVKESDILSDEDDDGFSETRRDSGDSSSPTSAIEAQFIELKLSEEAVLKCTPAPCVQPEGVGDTPEMEPKLMRRHFGAVKRKPNSLRRSQGALLSMKEHSRSLDSQTDAVSSSGVVDLNVLLEREFSVQSLTSVVNEDCFYDQVESSATDSGNAMSS
ncbi:T-lymphoma invasion and metastasis-inducing protein 2 isoform X2 [Sphaeramia orbicularis]|uniref:T-lymphoma invasion and metastasis-inducing protein 2 isoform X2 n=1 Tax=Sphaeramia orbicularis TaxID=375764 RepID=UPI001180D621|nr:T-lymphoma invasion and metastasis-inducing protein 2 isoform X2 [Sphaeramia orbicularis]